MPKGIKGFQKGHKSFVSKEGRKIITEKTRARMQKYKGIMPEWLKNTTPFVKGHKLQVGERHWAFKGDKVGKGAIHDWVKKRLGRPSKCEHCGTTEAKRFEWASINHSYSRNLKEWVRLCPPCHMKMDKRSEKLWATRRKNGTTYVRKTKVKN